MSDPAPLSARQLWALLAAMTREVAWGLPTVAHEVRRWRALAEAIPDAPIRADALKAISEQRGHIDGAALFSILPRRRNQHLLRVLVAYEVIWDYLDNVNERTAAAGVLNGLQLHLALIDALDPSQPIHEHYKHGPPQDDGAYLRALVTNCQADYARLPSTEHVRERVTTETPRTLVCAINHDPDPPSREAGLKAWATREFPGGHEATWFELTGAASTDLTIYALLALATEPTSPPEQALRTLIAYFPWISVLTAMLDSYVDQGEDLATGNHSYISHYRTTELAIHRICMLIRRCLQEAGALEYGEKHTVIAASMLAYYLCRDSALIPPMLHRTRRIIASGGPLARILYPIFRLWRIAYGLKSA
jgi:tetraprenyl-beta-curcumene synthase